ncbi:hypothetical protein ACLOJK_022655 [Asimina triloba]
MDLEGRTTGSFSGHGLDAGCVRWAIIHLDGRTDGLACVRPWSWVVGMIVVLLAGFGRLMDAGGGGWTSWVDGRHCWLVARRRQEGGLDGRQGDDSHDCARLGRMMEACSHLLPELRSGVGGVEFGLTASPVVGKDGDGGVLLWEAVERRDRAELSPASSRWRICHGGV